MRKLVLITVVLIIIAIPIAWISSRPSWQLSARNSPEGVIMDVYKSGEGEPTFTTVLAGESIKTEFERVARKELSPELGRTLFHDETLRPGRWTVVIGEAHFDIMERAMVVNGASEILPRD